MAEALQAGGALLLLQAAQRETSQNVLASYAQGRNEQDEEEQAQRVPVELGVVGGVWVEAGRLGKLHQVQVDDGDARKCGNE